MDKYHTYRDCDGGFYVPFSTDTGMIKFKNNDRRFRGRDFPNIDDENESSLEPEDITRGAIVSVTCSPYFYEYAGKGEGRKDKGKSGGARFEPDGCSLRMDYITLVARADAGSDFGSPPKKRKI
jgi:hypothetical protein